MIIFVEIGFFYIILRRKYWTSVVNRHELRIRKVKDLISPILISKILKIDKKEREREIRALEKYAGMQSYANFLETPYDTDTIRGEK